MATIDRPSSAVMFARVRALGDRLWQPLAAQRPAVKWGLALAVFLTLAAVSYWAAGSLSTLGVRYLASSKRFSSDDLIKVCRALDKQRDRVSSRRSAASGSDRRSIRPGGRDDLEARPGPASDRRDPQVDDLDPVSGMGRVNVKRRKS